MEPLQTLQPSLLSSAVQTPNEARKLRLPRWGTMPTYAKHALPPAHLRGREISSGPMWTGFQERTSLAAQIKGRKLPSAAELRARLSDFLSHPPAVIAAPAICIVKRREAPCITSRTAVRRAPEPALRRESSKPLRLPSARSGSRHCNSGIFSNSGAFRFS